MSLSKITVMKRSNKVWLPVLIIPVAVYLFYAYIFPLYSIFKQTFIFDQKDFSLNIPMLSKVLRFTFEEAILSTLITLLTGIVIAYVFSRFRFPGRRICMAILSVPFMLPTVVVAAGMNAWLGPKGVLNSLLMDMFSLKSAPLKMMNTFGIIIFTHVFYNTSLVIRMVSNSWQMIDRNIIHAAETLGAKPGDIFRKITFPLLKGSILSSALLVFLFDFTSYGVVLLMGGPRYRTLEVEISYQTLQVFDLKTAGVLSLIQLIITLIIVFFERRIALRESHFTKIKVLDENLKSPRGFSEKAFVILTVGTAMLITVLPMISLIFRSFYVPGADARGNSELSGFSLIYYKNLFVNSNNSFFFVSPGKAILYSLLNAILCSLIAVVFGALICVLARQAGAWHLMDSFVLLPIGTSAVTLGLGYLIAYRKSLTGMWITPIAHSIVVLPFVIRTLKPAIQNLPVSLRQSASLLGARPMVVFWKIDLPILRRSVVNSFIFAFTISMGEFGATSFLTRPERPTLPVAIYNYLSKPGGLNYGQAMAMSTILLVFSIACIFIMSDD